MISKILTHPGGAHKDDVLAVSVLIAKFGVPVVRREPTAADLSDPSVAVVDVGESHDPALMNFDHHQFPREHPPTCALSLVLQYLGVYEDALLFCDWLETAERFDSRGPGKTAKWLGVPRKAVAQLHSPVDITLLRRFAQKSTLSPDDPLYTFMGFVGEDLLDYLRGVRARIDFAAQHVQRWSIDHAGEVIEALYMPRTDPPAEDAKAALTNYIRAEGLGDSVSAIAYPDRRSGGYGLGRYEDHPKLDFSRVEHEADVTFAHKNGFVCKTSASTPERLQALIKGAWLV